MSKIFILQNFLARQVSGKINYLENEYWQKKIITGAEILNLTKDFSLSADDFNKLTIEQAKCLGFCKWSDKFEKYMR